MKKGFILFFLSLICVSCTNSDRVKKAEIKKQNAFAEPILRHHNTYFFPIFNPQSRIREPYPWEEGVCESLPRITKEYFRCKGSPLNIPIVDISNPDKPLTFEDCKGASHGLPLIHGREGVYPILIELLNYIQQKTKQKVVITCGHRCPIHNKYSDRSKNNLTSKHMIGAEVDFYVEGMEERPQDIVQLIFAFYKDKKGEVFSRYENRDSDVSIKPYFNKEIFVKIYKAKEGRDFDNRHPYPYISIQVRYDRDSGEKVVYSWEKASKIFSETNR